MLCAQDAAIGRIVDLVTEAQVVVCPYDGTVFEKDGACTHIDTCPVRSSPSFWLPFLLLLLPRQLVIAALLNHGRTPVSSSSSSSAAAASYTHRAWPSLDEAAG